MTEALWAQVISGFFGLASLALGAYLPYRWRQKDNNRSRGGDRPNGTDSSAAPQPEVTR